MPFTDSDLQALVPRVKRYRVAAGDSIYIDVYPGGGKYFVWKYRFLAPRDRNAGIRSVPKGEASENGP